MENIATEVIFQFVIILASCRDLRQTIALTLSKQKYQTIKENMKLKWKQTEMKSKKIRAWNKPTTHKSAPTKGQCLTTKLVLSRAIIRNMWLFSRPFCTFFFTSCRFFVDEFFLLSVVCIVWEIQSKKGLKFRTNQMSTFTYSLMMMMMLKQNAEEAIKLNV